MDNGQKVTTFTIELSLVLTVLAINLVNQAIY